MVREARLPPPEGASEAGVVRHGSQPRFRNTIEHSICLSGVAGEQKSGQERKGGETKDGRSLGAYLLCKQRQSSGAASRQQQQQASAARQREKGQERQPVAESVVRA